MPQDGTVEEEWVTSLWYLPQAIPPRRVFHSMEFKADMSFDALLESASEHPHMVDEIERRFGSIVAVLVVDFSSMRRRMDAFGTVPALLDIRLATHTYTPVIRASRGRIVKTLADTLFAIFDAPQDALQAAMDGHRCMKKLNMDRDGDIEQGIPNAPVHPKAGLGYGPSLLTPDGNLYGPEVNRAFILGEDVAANREILASAAFASGLGIPPVGVGLHGAPHDREDAAGFPFHVVNDFRFDEDEAPSTQKA